MTLHLFNNILMVAILDFCILNSTNPKILPLSLSLSLKSTTITVKIPPDPWS